LQFRQTFSRGKRSLPSQHVLFPISATIWI
jgi:hypothetical protein